MQKVDLSEIARKIKERIDTVIENIATEQISQVEACLYALKDATRQMWEGIEHPIFDVVELRILHKIGEFLEGALGCLRGAIGLLEATSSTLPMFDMLEKGREGKEN